MASGSEMGDRPARQVTAPSVDLNAMRERWGVEQTPVLLAGLLLTALALLAGSLGVTSYLIAGDDEFLQKLDAQVWLRLALGLAFGGAALLVFARWQSPRLRVATGEKNPDLNIGFVLGGLTLVFAFAGMIKGLDESFDATNAWFGYAYVFAVVTIGWFAISQPVPDAVGTVSASAIGLGLVAAGVIALVIGQVQGMSEDNSTFISGLAFQGLGTVAVLLALGWFLGLRPRDAS